jgi:hypothetical protein
MPDITLTRTITATEQASLDAFAQARGLTTPQLLERGLDELILDATTYFQTALKNLLPAAWAKATDQEKVALITQLRTISQRP